MDNQLKSYKSILIAITVGLVIHSISLLAFNNVESRLIGLIAFLVLLWTNRGLHLGVVSLLPIVLFPIFGVIDSKQVVVNYSKTTIFLFIGGFLLAIAAEKNDLHKIVSNKLLSIFPKTPRGVLYSIILSVGLISSVLSDTTTAILFMPIASFLTDDKEFKFRLLLGVAYASVIGGIITPIGTPPNLFLFGFLEDNSLEAISFIKWIAMMLPLAIIMLLLASEVLLFGLKKEIQFTTFESKKEKLTFNQKKIITIFIVLAILLVLNPILKEFFNFIINEKLLLLGLGLSLFTPMINLLDWEEDFKKIPFSVIFLFGAGFSIAMAFSKTGLAKDVASYLLKLNSLSPLVLMLIIGAGVVFLTELTSNTALTAITIPIVYVFAIKTGLDPILFMTIVAISASYAFMLPIATPANAIAMSTGDVTVKQMLKRGIFLNILGILITYVIVLTYWKAIL